MKEGENGREQVERLTVKRTKYFWLFSPTQLLTLERGKEGEKRELSNIQLLQIYKMFYIILQFRSLSSLPLTHQGQWWSIRWMQCSQVLQW